MFGIGPTELLLIGLLLLILFGPSKAASMARDFGRFITGAQRSVEDLKSEFYSEEVKEARHTVEEFRDEARRSVEELKKTEVASEGEKDKPSSEPRSEDQGEVDQRAPRLVAEEREQPKEEETPPPREEKAGGPAAQNEPQQRDQGRFKGYLFDA